jgi:hypothetical protein
MIQQRKISIALRRMGFSGDEIRTMPLEEALEYLGAFSEVLNPGKGGKTYQVRRRGKGS